MRSASISKALLGWTIALYLTARSVASDTAHSVSLPAAEAPVLTDLSLANFFGAGWNEPWVKRPHPDGAPDLTLLRVQSNLLLRSSRTDYYFERTTSSNKDRSVQYANELIEYALNRRLMLAAFGNYQWIDGRSAADRQGGAYGALLRLQLVDTPHASYAINYRAMAPNFGLGETQTLNSLALAGWHDLTPLGLNRVGLYWHVQEETYFGPRASGGRQNDLTYDLSLAKTWTSPNAVLGNFSTFLETYSKTDLDGRLHGQSVVMLTPGLRFNVQHSHVFMFGVDVPLSDPRPYDDLFRFTYIYCF